MENQYYTLIEKQDFMRSSKTSSANWQFLLTHAKALRLIRCWNLTVKDRSAGKRDGRLAVKLDNIDDETKRPLAEAEFVMIVELQGKMVERTYGVPVENVEETVFKGKQTRADELVRAKSREDVINSFGAVKIWSCGDKTTKEKR
ncbi:MAG: hypothetical protein ACLSHR_11745 [Oscillospiraceae bacterium]